MFIGSHTVITSTSTNPVPSFGLHRDLQTCGMHSHRHKYTTNLQHQCKPRKVIFLYLDCKSSTVNRCSFLQHHFYRSESHFNYYTNYLYNNQIKACCVTKVVEMDAFIQQIPVLFSLSRISTQFVININTKYMFFFQETEGIACFKK